MLLATIVASGTSWYLTMRNNLGNTEDKLEAQTIAQSEWERLSHMSLDELEANRNTLKNPYSAGTGSQFSISVNLGEKGTFNNGTCGAVSGGYANCFKNTTITVYQDGNRVFTTRTLPLMAGDYTRQEIDAKLSALNTRINNETTARTNADNSLTARLNGKEFVKNRTTSYDLNLRYEKKAGDDVYSLHAYNGNTEIPLASQGGVKGKSLYSGVGNGAITINAKNYKILFLKFGNNQGSGLLDNGYWRQWQGVVNLDTAVSTGYIAFRNRGGENADRDYDFIWTVSKSGDNITFTPTSSNHGTRGAISSIIGY